MSPAPWPPWVICHLPADSAAIPVEIRPWLRLSERELAEELARRTSPRTADLFARSLPEHQLVRAEFSPLVMDIALPASGQGGGDYALRGIDRTTPDSGVMSLLSAWKPLTQAELEVLADEYYHPHQAWLATRVALKLAVHGRCLVLNTLSFPPAEDAFEVDENLTPLPDIRLGAHPVHTPRRLLDLFEAAFLGHAWRVQVAPGHSAAMVPHLHDGQDRRVHCLSIELNRHLYWDSRRGHPNQHYEAFRERLTAALGAAFSRLD